MSDEPVIELDGSAWKDVLTFLAALKVAIRAPHWHGWSPAAFIDSMIWGGINNLDPPYTIMVKELERAPTEVVEYVDLISRCLADADEEHLASKGMRVNVKLVRAPTQSS